jgi:hypothetical protein
MPERIQQWRATRFLIATLAASSIGLIGACSDKPVESASAKQPNSQATVASIPSASSAGTPAATTAVSTDGPLLRYDTTEEEETRLYATYNACLRREGVPASATKAGMGISQDRETLAKYKTELIACASKKPESVPDRQKRENPAAFAQHLRQQIRCMKKAGQDVVFIPPDGWGVTDQAAARGYVPDFKVVNRCQQKAFGG